MHQPIDKIAIIIGAMKGGTTSLYYYLIQHPAICAAAVKEPEFFSEYQGNQITASNYYDLWEYDDTRHQVALEASTGYSKYPFEKNVYQKMFNYGIKPKLIYCVRNPIHRIHSQYQFVKDNPHWPTHNLLSNKNIALSKYFYQLQQVRKYFPKKDILIIDFDDIAQNPQKAVNQVFEFLDLPPFQVNHSFVYNRTNKVEQFLERYYPKFLPFILQKLIIKLIRLVTKKRKTTITKSENAHIIQQLQSDMLSFQKEYNFDVKKWGFKE